MQRPAVLIAHEGPGLDDHQRFRADQLAELGYVAFALDHQGDGQPMTDRKAMMARLDKLWHDPERTRDLARTGLDILLTQPRADPTQVAALGYRFSGHLVLELARAGTNLAAAVGSHPHVDRIKIPGLRFDQISAQRSWRTMLDLFNETFS